MEKGQLGPKMKAINARQRKFVEAVLMQGNRNYTAAYKVAYPDAQSQNAARVSAHRLSHDEKILAALKEETERRMQASVAMAAEVLLAIAEDPTHKDRLKAATAILNRSGMHESVEHKFTHDVSTDAKSLLARFSVLAGTLGVDPVAILGRAGVALPKPEVIEGEYTEVDAEPAPVNTEVDEDTSWIS